MRTFIYTEENPGPNDMSIEGLVLLDDNETFSDIKGTRVIIFDKTDDAKLAMDKIKRIKDIDYGFLAALDGHAEEISIDRLVKFYLANGM